MPVIVKEAARAAGPDALGLHRPPRRQRDDVARRAGRLVARLSCSSAGLVDDPAPGLVGAGHPGAPLVVDGDRRERVRPLGLAVADHLVVAAADVPAAQPRRAGRPQVRRLRRQRRDGSGLGALDDQEVSRRGGRRPDADAGVARRQRQHRERGQRERHHLTAPPKTARPHVRRYYVTSDPSRSRAGRARRALTSGRAAGPRPPRPRRARRRPRAGAAWSRRRPAGPSPSSRPTTSAPRSSAPSRARPTRAPPPPTPSCAGTTPACSTARPPTTGPPPPAPAPRARWRTRSPRPSTRPACRKRWPGTSASAPRRWNSCRSTRGARSCSGRRWRSDATCAPS